MSADRHDPLAGATLAEYQASIRACRICAEKPVGAPLPHEPRPVVRGSADAPILIAGQAPGIRVHESGLPFDDASGNRLRDWMGVDRPTFYDEGRIGVAAMGFCFPGWDRHGGDLPPRKECAPTWRDGLMARMPAVRLLLAIGLHAQRYHLGPLRQRTMTDTVADWRRIAEETRRDGAMILPMPHPSWRNTGWLKRHPWFEAEFLPVLRREVARCLGGRDLSELAARRALRQKRRD